MTTEIKLEALLDAKVLSRLQKNGAVVYGEFDICTLNGCWLLVARRLGGGSVDHQARTYPRLFKIIVPMQDFTVVYIYTGLSE